MLPLTEASGKDGSNPWWWRTDQRYTGARTLGFKGSGAAMLPIEEAEQGCLVTVGPGKGVQERLCASWVEERGARQGDPTQTLA